MERSSTREEFCQAVQRLTEAFAAALWTTVVETGSADADLANGVLRASGASKPV
jgi:hypothetical protein